MGRSFASISTLCIGAGLLIVASGSYLSGAVKCSLDRAAWVVACRCEIALRCLLTCFSYGVVVHFSTIIDGFNPFHLRCDDSCDQGQAKRWG